MKKIGIGIGLLLLVIAAISLSWPKPQPKPDAVGYLELSRHSVYSLWPGRCKIALDRTGQTVEANQVVAVVETFQPANAVTENWQEKLVTAQILYEAAQEQARLAPQNEECLTALKLAESNLKQTELLAAKNSLDYHQAEQSLISQVPGVVLQILCQKDEIIWPGRKVMEIGQYDPAWVEVWLPEEKISELEIGQTVKAVAQGSPKQVFFGKIYEIGQVGELKPDAESQKLKTSFPIRIAFPNQDYALKAGMTMQVWWQF